MILLFWFLITKNGIIEAWQKFEKGIQQKENKLVGRLGRQGTHINKSERCIERKLEIRVCHDQNLRVRKLNSGDASFNFLLCDFN